jgi:hypothetical protein
MSVGATLRAMEIEVGGEIVASAEGLALRVSSDEILSLAPLTVKAQWDHAKKRPRPVTRAERESLGKLLRETRKRAWRCTITGPLRINPGKRVTLEVREYKWMTTPPSR